MPAVVVMSAAVHSADWGTDYAVALAQAEREGKAVLVDFTGSVWCGYCIRLRAEVLEEPRFSAWAGEHFVLLEVDMLKNPHFDEDLRAQNQMLCKKYGVDGFPTLMVLDARGNALGALYGYEGNPDIAREILTRGLTVQGFLKKAPSYLSKLFRAWTEQCNQQHYLIFRSKNIRVFLRGSQPLPYV